MEIDSKSEKVERDGEKNRFKNERRREVTKFETKGIKKMRGNIKERK